MVQIIAIVFCALDHLAAYAHFLLSRCFCPQVAIIFVPYLPACVFAIIPHLLKPRGFSLFSSVFSQFFRTWTCGASLSSVPSTPTASM